LNASGEVYRFTVDQYDRMVRDGTIDEDDPVELLDGIVVRCDQRRRWMARRLPTFTTRMTSS